MGRLGEVTTAERRMNTIAHVRFSIYKSDPRRLLTLLRARDWLEIEGSMSIYTAYMA